MLTHAPFRSWCAHCVKGSCVAGKHTTRAHDQGEVSTVHFDYCFLVKRKKGESEESYGQRRGSPNLVGYDSHTRMITADFVPKKAVDPWAIKRVKRFIEMLGHTRVV